MMIRARAEGAYWVVEAEQDHGDVYVVRRFHVIDADLVTLRTIAAVVNGGDTSAGDRWCRDCQNRLHHDWIVTDGVLRAVCARGHEYRRAP